MTSQEDELPKLLELEGPQALKLLAHEARQRVISETYEGRELTATEAAELCGLTPSAMSYHLRMLEKAGVLLPSEADDGRERRYRRAARSFRVRQGERGAGSRLQLRTTVGIWIDTLTRAVERWVDAGSTGTGAMSTQVLRLTEEQSADLLSRLNLLFDEYDEISETNGPDVGEWETHWAHVPRVGR
ncbi:winged helix-turn-helix domain-containing protein [Pseudactinotalea sp.]|uniref:winged helix-turn-helix domain-containing protein n=1 Tax=Pseudactinotalea sp. TaxID=1926260 RepID=UPI003B3A4972